MIFDKQFFIDHQRNLLVVANNKWLRWLLGLNRLPEKLKELKISRIGPNFITSGDTSYFFTRYRFSEALVFNLSPFSYLQNFRLKKWQWRFSPVGTLSCLLLALFPKLIGGFYIFGTVDSYYSGAGDGYIEGTGASFAAAHDNATGSSVNYTSVSASIYVYRDAGSTWWIRRGALPFDTSGLPDTDVISAATLYWYATGAWVNDDADSNSYVGVVHTFTASNTVLATGDYDDIGSDNDTGGRAMQPNIQQGAATVALSTITGAGYYSHALNATGLAWISNTSYTKLGIREGHDILEDLPGFAANKFNGGGFYCSEQTGTANDPYISITHAPASTGRPKTLASLGVGS